MYLQHYLLLFNDIHFSSEIDKFIWWIQQQRYVSKSIKIQDRIYAQITFPDGFVSQEILNKDLIVWLNGTIPANNCTPPSFPGPLTQQTCPLMYVKVS